MPGYMCVCCACTLDCIHAKLVMLRLAAIWAQKRPASAFARICGLHMYLLTVQDLAEKEPPEKKARSE